MNPELLTKSEAVARLNVSERSLERYVKAGRITPVYQTGTDSKGRTSQLAHFAASDLDALKAAMDAPTPAPMVKTIDVAPVSDKPARQPDITTQPDNPTLAALVALSANAASPLWLSLKEAAGLSGLPLADLRRAVQSGELANIRTGRGVRFRRDAVLAWAMQPTVRVPVTSNPPKRKTAPA